MDNVEKIIADILDDARKAADETLAQANAQAKKLTDDAERAAEADAQAVLAKAEKDAASRRERSGSTSALERRKLLLKAKREVLDTVFTQLNARFLSLPEVEYAADLAALARTCDGGDLLFSRRDAGLADAVLAQLDPALFRRSEEISDLPDGFLLRNGNVETECSFSALIAEQRTRLEPLAASKLFE